jgi:flagellar P-ring protein FlgI
MAFLRHIAGLCIFIAILTLVWGEARSEIGEAILLPPQDKPALIAPPGGLIGFQTAPQDGIVPLGTLVHLRGVRVNHLIGYGLIVGLQNTGDTQQTLFSIQFLLNTLRHANVTLPAAVNPSNIQTRNMAAVIVTADMPPFARVGSRIDALVSAIGDARSLQGGTLLMAPLRGADERVYALAQGSITIEGFFAGAAGGASARKNFQTAGQVAGGVTIEREVPNDFGKLRTVQIDLDDPDSGLAQRAASALASQYKEAQVSVTDPGTIQVTLPSWMSAVTLVAGLNDIPVQAADSDKVVMDERTGTIVVGGRVTVGKAAVSHGNLTLVIEPKSQISQPAPFSLGTTVTEKTAKLSVNQEQGQFFMLPQGASVEQIAETLNAIGTKPGDVIAIFEGLHAAGALHGKLIVR